MPCCLGAALHLSQKQCTLSSSASFSGLPGSVHSLPADQDSLMSHMLACPAGQRGGLLADRLMGFFTWRVSCTLLLQPSQVMPCTLISSSMTSSAPAVTELALICCGTHGSTTSTVHQQPIPCQSRSAIGLRLRAGTTIA